MTDKIKEDIGKICTDILWDEPMKLHTTFRVGGNATCFASPASAESLIKLIKYCDRNQISFYLIGNGSNLLVSDKGIEGIVIHVGKNLSNIRFWDGYSDVAGCKIPDYIKNSEKKIVFAEAGALLSAVSAFALKHSLKGMEFASGIPGTLGGGFVMNAGAYDGELSQICVGSVAYDTENDSVIFLDISKQNFGYRSSVYQKKGYIILCGILALEEGNEDEIRIKIDDFSQRRRNKQPLNLPSAGSTFKRPEGAFAGKLIEDCGLKGYSVGDAQISEKHCGFVVNNGNASCNEIIELIEHVRTVVKEKTGYVLEPEVKYLGENHVFCSRS